MDKESLRRQEDTGQKITPQFVGVLNDFKKHFLSLERRLTRMESTLENFIENSHSVQPTQAATPSHETIDKFITEHIQERLAKKEDDGLCDLEGVNSHWNYFIAQKGGYDEVLYMTVQDFLNFDLDPVAFLAFLLEKRTEEVKESLRHLRTEYENLEGNQLQAHFTELWELHHNLLKKKVIRTWKEEIFLEAFEAFLLWIQQENNIT